MQLDSLEFVLGENRIASRTFRDRKTTAKPTLFDVTWITEKELERVKGKGRISLEPKNMKKS